MKKRYQVVCLCGIGYVSHTMVHASSKEEAMEFMRERLEIWPDYYDHAGGLIKVHDAWIIE